jgi:transposase
MDRSPLASLTRYDKLAANYLAFVQLASIRLWLSANDSTS